MARRDDDLRINTLHALAKHSPGLILEEHSHCEVPAGCGGVVLRWRDPEAGTPAIVSVAHTGAARVWLDGAELTSGYAALRPGVRVLTLELRGLTVPSPILVAIRPQIDGPTLYASSVATKHAGAAAWQWRPLDAPDTAFAPMAAAYDLPTPDAWRFTRLSRAGAMSLRAEAPDIVVRFTFDHRVRP